MERFRVRVVPLQSDLHLGRAVGFLRLEVHDPVQRLAALRKVSHEVHEASGGLEDFFRPDALVDQVDLDPLVEERQLLQPVCKDLALELNALGEDLGVRPEADQGPGLGSASAVGGSAVHAVGHGSLLARQREGVPKGRGVGAVAHCNQQPADLAWRGPV